MASNPATNYFLPAYSTGPGLGEIYTDVRLESDKKNLLTLPTDPNRMYIKPARGAPAAEVIVYPMGQLLGQNHQHQQQQQQQQQQYPQQVSLEALRLGQQDTMAMAGTSEIEIAQDGRVVVAPPGGKSVKMAAAGGGEGAPQGLLQTLVRSAKDDLKIVGNVFKHLTGGS
jgi:hypothetical protein